ncbi:MAG: 2-hydroxyacid dehydrogenase [Kiritimatiellae bacterium]|nr:2-hydroxyacid dehydrogenase [Kiritimatiellia bacterium]MDD4735859.1 2-hydroxyacid dehydrogenase [Kiritimatiellia bacterium]
MSRTISFFDAKPYDQKSFDEVNESFGFQIRYLNMRLGPETVALARGAEAVCVFVNDVVNKEVIDALVEQGVKIIALRCAGYNNVDLIEAYERLPVVRVPAYSPHAVAEHAAALVLSLNRKTHRAYYRTRDGNFNINGFIGYDMNGKTIGVIGTGKIGQIFIRIMRGFGTRVLAFDPYPKEETARELGFEYADLDRLYAESDVISLQCPLTPDNLHMLNREAFEKMKPGVCLINTGRGKLVDTHDLIDALKSGRVGSAGLDVYEEEDKYFFEDFSSEIIQDDTLARLLTFPNVLVTSHQAFFTKEAMHAIAETTLENLRLFFAGEPGPNEICRHCNDHPARCQTKCRASNAKSIQ